MESITDRVRCFTLGALALGMLCIVGCDAAAWNYELTPVGGVLPPPGRLPKDACRTPLGVGLFCGDAPGANAPGPFDQRKTSILWVLTGDDGAVLAKSYSCSEFHGYGMMTTVDRRFVMEAPIPYDWLFDSVELWPSGDTAAVLRKALADIAPEPPLGIPAPASAPTTGPTGASAPTTQTTGPARPPGALTGGELIRRLEKALAAGRTGPPPDRHVALRTMILMAALTAVPTNYPPGKLAPSPDLSAMNLWDGFSRASRGGYSWSKTAPDGTRYSVQNLGGGRIRVESTFSSVQFAWSKPAK